MRVLGLFLLFIFLISCSGESGESAPVSITLSSNRGIILANGQDEAVLTVVDEQGRDVTEVCSFSSNDENLIEPKFKTNKIGVFQLNATYQGVISNIVQIKSVDKVEVDLKSDKIKFLADGTDGVALKLMSNLGEDLTGLASFYAGGQQIAGTFFATNTPGNYSITAKYSGLPVNGVIEVAGVSSIDFVSRILAEDITSVQCPNCPRVVRLLDIVTKKHPDVVVAAWHNEMNGKSDPMEKKPESVEIRRLFGATFYPYVYLHREKLWDENISYFDNYPRLPGEAGIALDCRLAGEQLQIIAGISGVKAFAGARYVAILLENGIVSGQMDSFGYVASYVHNHVVREVSSVKGDVIDIPVKEIVKRTVTLPWKDTYKKENCKALFIVMNGSGTVINVQTVKIGERVGY